MVGNSETERFIRSVFGSIWSLELLLILRRKQDREWTRSELIEALRASEHVLARSCLDLGSAGLIAERGEVIRYAPATAALDAQVGSVERLYASRPAYVRRAIVGGDPGSIESFADAFRIRRE